MVRELRHQVNSSRRWNWPVLCCLVTDTSKVLRSLSRHSVRYVRSEQRLPDCWYATPVHAIMNKISPVRDWWSTPTYCQIQSHVTQKTGTKIKNRARKSFRYCPPNLRINGHLPAPIVNEEGDSLWKWPNFSTFKSSWPWPWIGSYCIPSCITRRPLHTHQIYWNWRNFLWTDRRVDRHLRPTLLGRLTRRSRPKKQCLDDQWNLHTKAGYVSHNSYLSLIFVRRQLSLGTPYIYIHTNSECDGKAVMLIKTSSNRKGKGFPYSLPSVGPGTDPGVQAVSPQMAAITFLQACGYLPSHRASPPLWPVPSYTAWWRRHIGVNNLPPRLLRSFCPE